MWNLQNRNTCKCRISQGWGKVHEVRTPCVSQCTCEAKKWRKFCLLTQAKNLLEKTSSNYCLKNKSSKTVHQETIKWRDDVANMWYKVSSASRILQMKATIMATGMINVHFTCNFQSIICIHTSTTTCLGAISVLRSKYKKRGTGMMSTGMIKIKIISPSIFIFVTKCQVH